MVRIAINLFLSYMLEIVTAKRTHCREVCMESIVSQYRLHCDTILASMAVVKCVRGHNNIERYEIAFQEAILEVVDILERHYVGDVKAVLNELNVNHTIEELSYHLMSETTLYVLARCTNTLPPPKSQDT